MLYYIDDSVIKSAKDGVDEVVINKLKNLLYCWKNGLCHLNTSRDNYEQLSSIEGLEEFSVVQKYAQGIVSLYSQLDFFVYLVDGASKPSSLQKWSGKYTIVQIRDLDNILDIGINYFVCENVKDFDYYRWCLKELIPDCKNPSYCLNIIPYNGGGGSTEEALKHLERYFCVVVCDSDKRSEVDAEGGTCKDVESYIYSVHRNNLWYYRLTVHEIENLIPLAFLEKVTAKGQIKRLKQISEHPNGDMYLQYFDFKEGFKESDLRRIKAKSISIFQNYKKLFLYVGIKKAILQKYLNRKYAPNRADEAIIPGFGKNLLDLTIAYFSTNVVVPYSFASYQLTDLNKITNMMWSLGCAIAPKRL